MTGWSVSAAFVDYDRDGWLDLYVGHYVNYSPDANIRCFSLTGRPDYCSPNVYRAQPSRLYHNNRDGTFTDVTRAAGIAPNSVRRLAWSPPTSTATGGSTSTSRTTARRTSSGSTSETGRSRYRSSIGLRVER